MFSGGVLGLFAWASCQAECTGPSYQALRPPRYPPAALAVRASGQVLIRIAVAADGGLGSPELQTSSKNDDLDRAAIEAVSAWRFSPRICDGRAVDSEAFVPIEFNLHDEDAAEVHGNPGSLTYDPIASHRDVRIVQDESSIPFANAAALLAFLERQDGVVKGRVLALDETRTMRYYVLPREGLVFDVLESSEFGWTVAGGGARFALRSRHAREGSAQIILYSHLCDGPDQWCEQILTMYLTRMQRDPPPEPPPAPR